MANVSDNVNKIRKAVYGEEVRSAIADSIEAMNSESSNAFSAAVSSQSSALNSAASAAASAEEARIAAEQAMSSIPSGYGQLVIDVDNLKKDLDQSLYGENAGGKNLLNPTLPTTVLNGVTCTKNTDGTYTLNGTASADTTFRLVDDNILKSILTNNKSVRLVGSPQSDVYLQIWIKEQGTSRDRGNGVNINTNGITITSCNIVIVIPNGVVCNNYVLKPMITTDLTATYNSFTQWAPSAKQLSALSGDVEMLNEILNKVLTIKTITRTTGGSGNVTLVSFERVISAIVISKDGGNCEGYCIPTYEVDSNSKITKIKCFNADGTLMAGNTVTVEYISII